MIFYPMENDFISYVTLAFLPDRIEVDKAR